MARHLNVLFTELLFELTLPFQLLVLTQAILITVDISLCTLPTKERDNTLILLITTLLNSLPPVDPAFPGVFRPFNKPIGLHEDDADAFVDDFLSLPPLRRLSEFTLHLFLSMSQRRDEIFSDDEDLDDEDILLAQFILSHLSTRLTASLHVLQRVQQRRPTPVPLADGHVFGPLTADTTPRPSPSSKP